MNMNRYKKEYLKGEVRVFLFVGVYFVTSQLVWVVAMDSRFRGNDGSGIPVIGHKYNLPLIIENALYF
jgi:hypothetical protein